jgi:methyl-accepting chemotaxis protein
MNQYHENNGLKISNDFSSSPTATSLPNSQRKSPLNPSAKFIPESMMPKRSPETEAKESSWWQVPISFWDNLPIKTKITTLLIVGATIPVIAVTQGIVEFAKKESISVLQKSLETNLTILEQEIEQNTNKLQSMANTLALAVEASGIDPQLATTDPSQLQKLAYFIRTVKTQYDDLNASFYIITDNQGRTVAQFIQTIEGNFTTYPPLPTEEGLEPVFSQVSLPTGIPLGDVPIVQSTLRLSQPLQGFELLNGEVLKRLGLDKQANIGVRQQEIEGLPEPKKPYPEGTFKTDNGQAGFVLMATEPIKLQDNKVGTAIIGTLVNRNFDIVDDLKEKTGISTATIFAQDWRVSTNVPYTDHKTRAIGTRVSREVADRVLNNKQDFLGRANIIGIEYLTGYAPIYDHYQQINQEKSKPIGIAYVGEPMTKVHQELRQITLIGYAVGSGVLSLFALVLMVTPSDAAISRQLVRLTEFAGKVASGESGVRLEHTERQDEIGVLTRNLNEMAQNVDTNLETRQQEAEQQRQKKETLEQEIYQLLNELQGALDGDLTVRASLSSMEMSTVADLFNAIIDSLKDIAIQVKESSNQVSSSLVENKQSIELLAEQAVQEAEETNKTLDSVEQMSLSIQEVSQNANQAAILADDAYSVTKESTSAMDETVKSILSLRTTVGETAKKMKRLGESSQKISQVVSLIEEIALKTNLLAINASVEASHAGEQGQGFTIVAEQVAALAEQSAAATKEIAQIVEAIQLETQEVSEAMELGTSQVVDSSQLVESTKQRLEKVLERSQSINELMQSISQATISQTDTSLLVTKLMQQIAQYSAQRLVSSQQVAQSMQATAKVSQNLEFAVEQFKVS